MASTEKQKTEAQEISCHSFSPRKIGIKYSTTAELESHK
jgi:hypothetical protein